VGVGAAGYIDRSRSTVLFAPNLAWRDVDLKAELEPRVNLPVVIENDANAAAWGEFTYGAGQDVDDLLLVTVGTGVGGGLVLDGQLYRGAFGVGAEIGHLRVVPDGRLCGCGNHGCFEQYGSGSALVRNAREAATAGSLLARTLLDRAGGDPDAIDGPLITEAARDGDTFAVEQLAEIGRWLGEGIASLTAVLDPAVVAIGGGVSDADELLLDPIRVAFERSLPGRGHRPMLEIRKATLGNRAGLIGAADLARR
jgi:glucokinase